MKAFKIYKNKNYTVISNEHLFDKNLSLKTKGLLTIMLALNDKWKYTIKGLCTLTGEGYESISRCLKELEKNHYLLRDQERNESGKLGNMTYCIFESPKFLDQLIKDYENSPEYDAFDYTEKAILKALDRLGEKPQTAKPLTAKPKQLNNNNIITSKIKTNNINTNEKIFKKTEQNNKELEEFNKEMTEVFKDM